MEFLVEEDFKVDKRYASGLNLLVRGDQKRELGQVRSIFTNCFLPAYANTLFIGAPKL